MSWRDEPATQSQLITLRDLYWRGSNYENAMARVKSMKERGITKGEASEEIAKLQTMKAEGRLIGNL